MELSREDALRLNVLLAGELHAIRIDESAMTVYGLSARGEAQIKLNPNRRGDQYLRLVRETISGHVLGSPGGYPVYLKRWTRMGQARTQNLAQLLKLGEPEAVAAVVHASGLTEELARHAWWAMPSAENARSMLRRAAVVNSRLGPMLADYLIDYLPFETEPAAAVETVRLVLQPALISAQARQELWHRANNKPAYQVGFLLACPDDLPLAPAARADVGQRIETLTPLLAGGNPFAHQLTRIWSGNGQAFVQAVEQVLRRPSDQDIVLLLFKAIADYFRSVRIGDEEDLESLMREAANCCAGHGDIAPEQQAALQQIIQCCPESRPDIEGMLVLARLGYPAVRPVFSRTTAIGSLMRKKLEPVTRHLLAYLHQLQGQGN